MDLICVCVCMEGVGGFWWVLINCADVDFLSQIHILLNNLHIKYPPPAPPKPITGTHRRGPTVVVVKCVCGLTPSYTHTHPPQPCHSLFFCLKSTVTLTQIWGAVFETPRERLTVGLTVTTTTTCTVYLFMHKHLLWPSLPTRVKTHINKQGWTHDAQSKHCECTRAQSAPLTPWIAQHQVYVCLCVLVWERWWIASSDKGT